MALKKYMDTARDQETLVAVRTARASMEAIEYAYFKESSVPWSEVERLRDEYWDVWEERRNFVLSEKYGIEAPARV